MSVSVNSSFFEVFDLVPVFTVDLSEIGERYRGLQRAFHPDKFVNEGSSVRRQAVQMAAHINQAHETLKDPLLRARYLLELRGDDRRKEEAVTSQDGAFLMKQMEFRERLEELVDASEPFVAADALRLELMREEGLLFAEFESSFKSDDLPTAKKCVTELQFYHRLLASLKETEARLEDELF